MSCSSLVVGGVVVRLLQVAIRCLLFVVCCLLFAICCMSFVVCCLSFKGVVPACCVFVIVSSVPSAMYLCLIFVDR